MPPGPPPIAIAGLGLPSIAASRPAPAFDLERADVSASQYLDGY
jgi:hypothetical protein